MGFHKLCDWDEFFTFQNLFGNCENDLLVAALICFVSIVGITLHQYYLDYFAQHDPCAQRNLEGRGCVCCCQGSKSKASFNMRDTIQQQCCGEKVNPCHGREYGAGHGAGYGTGYGAGHGTGCGTGYGAGHGTGYGTGYGAGYGTGYGRKSSQHVNCYNH